MISGLSKKGEAFAQYNVITDEIDATPQIHRQTSCRMPVGEQTIARVMMALKKSKNSLTLGPDGMSCRVWKVIKNTQLR